MLITPQDRITYYKLFAALDWLDADAQIDKEDLVDGLKRFDAKLKELM